MQATPIRAIEKTLRDGRSFILDLVPRDGESKWVYWMRARIDGEVVGDRFDASVERNRIDLDGLKHVIRIAVGHKWQPVGLTDAEADAIDAAKKQWTKRYEQAALTAAPDAPTWTVHAVPWKLRPGMTGYDNGRPVMILKRVKKWWTEDGRSFGLDEEEGWLYSYLVRDLTDEERAERETGL